LRKLEQRRTEVEFIIAGVIAIALLVYLVYAMFNPDKFN
jgi:K+-transporting ATPase KdpF subunit